MGLGTRTKFGKNDSNNLNYFYTKNEKRSDNVNFHIIDNGITENSLHDTLNDKKKEPDITGRLWRERDEQPQLTSTGALLFEISPWMWRNLALIHYHLSSSQEGMRDLFVLGVEDARTHHHQFEKFFN